MPKKRKSQFLRALEERQAEARRERLQAEARDSSASLGSADANEPRPAKPEDKVLRERPPALWPAKKRRPQWK
jgi:hypothetical protein